MEARQGHDAVAASDHALFGDCGTQHFEVGRKIHDSDIKMCRVDAGGHRASVSIV